MTGSFDRFLTRAAGAASAFATSASVPVPWFDSGRIGERSLTDC